MVEVESGGAPCSGGIERVVTICVTALEKNFSSCYADISHAYNEQITRWRFPVIMLGDFDTRGKGEPSTRLEDVETTNSDIPLLDLQCVGRTLLSGLLARFRRRRCTQEMLSCNASAIVGYSPHSGL